MPGQDDGDGINAFLVTVNWGVGSDDGNHEEEFSVIDDGETETRLLRGRGRFGGQSWFTLT